MEDILLRNWLQTVHGGMGNKNEEVDAEGGHKSKGSKWASGDGAGEPAHVSIGGNGREGGMGESY